MLSDDQKNTVLAATTAASNQWQSAFNAGNAALCSAQYEPTAIMHARPFGTFTGTAEIQGFWEKLMADGFSEVEYLDPKIEVMDQTRAVLTSGWQMNNAKGVIHKELWVLQTDGTAKLREDDFEAIG